ncbi:hypothetical protein CDL15_Pgr003735 [Punica granatum]|uniref:Bifunctional inhibitor/plant lipid transfer protein/seed storage helical domain-containing protein n=1 Tax=Punica granatum TaxID=22663 RepID=A0A218XTN6_PUNGR|nr:hypothetical protein CDL15_Pgr003735 [Punica granatum]
MKKGTSSSPWALLLLLAGLVSAIALGFDFGIGMASAQDVSPSQCRDEIQQGISACLPVAMGQPPSPACCERVRVTHPECVCPYVTSEVATMVDPKRAKKLIEGCGRKVPPHYKCGSNIIISLYLHIVHQLTCLIPK